MQGGGVDGAIAALAERQHGVVGRAQLLGLGVTERSIDGRLARRRLRRVHRGVYAEGHAQLGADARAMAAVLLAGPWAVLSHRSAAALWGMLRSWPKRADVWVPRERRPSEVLSYHCAAIERDELTMLRGIPITSVTRTIFDLAAVQTPQRVAAAMKEAEVQRLTDPLSLDDLLARYPRRRGAGVIRALLDAIEPGSGHTRSELELAFIEFLVAVGLPLPETNVWLKVGNRWIEADCVWRRQKVIAELDGRAYHQTTVAFDADRSRDRALHAARWRPIRITWRHVHDEPDELESDLRVLLAA
jgi:hypothetical protein